MHRGKKMGNLRVRIEGVSCFAEMNLEEGAIERRDGRSFAAGGGKASTFDHVHWHVQVLYEKVLTKETQSYQLGNRPDYWMALLELMRAKHAEHL